MGEVFITRRGGGGGSKPYAVIGVTYPAGSACVCSNGSKTLKAKDTSGTALFSIPSAGEWVVTATSADGSKTKSVTVNITTKGQVETAKLAYELVLLDSENGGLLSGYSLGDGKSNSIIPAIDITGYSKVEIKGEPTYTYTSGYYTNWGLRKTLDSSLDAQITLDYSKNFTIDISSLTGTYFFGAHNDAWLEFTDNNTAIHNISSVAVGRIRYIKFS